MPYSGSCHCGAISFELAGEIGEVIDCNCSLCRRRGGLLAFFPREALRLATPASALHTYRFHNRVLDHHFCAACGIAPFSEGVDPGSGARMAAVNVRCLDGVDLAGLKVVRVDGAGL